MKRWRFYFILFYIFFSKNSQFWSHQSHQLHCWQLSITSACEAFHSCQHHLQSLQLIAPLCMEPPLSHANKQVLIRKKKKKEIDIYLTLTNRDKLLWSSIHITTNFFINFINIYIHQTSVTPKLKIAICSQLFYS